MVLFSGIQAQPMEMLKRTGLAERIAPDHMFEHTGEAIDYALLHLDHQKCLGCKHFAFRECATLSSAGALPERKGVLEPGIRTKANSPV
jgi:SulP family sulfate permease